MSMYVCMHVYMYIYAGMYAQLQICIVGIFVRIKPLSNALGPIGVIA